MRGFFAQNEASQMSNQPATCPDCNGPLGEITLLDSTGPQVGSTDQPYIPLTYRTPDDSKHWLTTDFEKSGIVRSMACAECGRIFLYTRRRP